MPKIVHFEIPVNDAERAKAFYQDAFGWEITGYGDFPYWLVRAGEDDEPGADGALIARGELHQSPVIVVGVEDIDAAVSGTQKAGAELLQGKQAIPSVGWAAYIRDPEGNVIGIFQPDSAAG